MSETVVHTTAAWRGIFAIPVTPFHDDLSIDHDGLRRQVEFCLASGADGLVYPGVVSEFFTLSDTERRSAVETILHAAEGRIPAIAGVAAPSAPVAADLARHAADAGATGVMAMLPYVQHFHPPAAAQISAYFHAIATAGKLPIVLQNARIGHTVPDAVLPGLIDDVPAIRYLKEERAPGTHQLSAAIANVGPKLDGVFAGFGGIHLLSELDRGAAGSMPAPPIVDVLVAAYRHHRAGDRAAARELLTPLGGYFGLESLYNLSIIKELLVRRGVIASTACRAPAPVLDAVDANELAEILDSAGVRPWTG